ncbi:hypothetical protein [uncultured Nocardioides sp.]|uniref:hypothetical protein n=1 Tax=uncultured Nocardioides sp. TaxID=198441 RepID=UPI00262B5C1D|nr:hypothetical protein [uncultured Nocardioides sp.]
MRVRRLLSGAASVLALALVGAASTTPLTLASAGSTALLSSSPTDASVRLADRPAVGDSEVTAEVVVDRSSSALRQEWIGVGAALTDASVTHLEGRPDLVSMLFGQEPGAIGLEWLRLPLSATDMSTTPWAWKSGTRGIRPSRPAREAIRFLRREVLPVAPGLQVMASAWTAPPAYKTNRSWFGGRLRGDRVKKYARFLVGQARWLTSHGVPLGSISLGNEPGHTSDYPTMAIGDRQLTRLARRVAAPLDSLGVELWGLDHNWADLPRLDATGTAGLDAIALHCYEGAPGQAAGLGLPWLVTECTGTDDGPISTFAWDSKNLVVDAVAAGSTGLLMWNLALSPGWRGAFGGCWTCRGLVTVDGGTVRREPEFFALAHLRRAAPAGSHAAPVTTAGPLLATGFASGPAGEGRVGVYGFNTSDQTQTLRVRTSDGALASVHEVGPYEIFSWVGQG